MAPPPPPPPRTKPGDYHYHVYDWEGATAPWELSPAQPDPPNYRFYSMVRDLDGLREYGAWKGIPNIALTAIGAPTSGGRKTMALSFGNKDRLKGQPTVLITGGIHAREWAATEMAYLLAEYLLVNYSAQPPVTKYQRAIRDLIDTRAIHIIPMVNPDGNWHTVFGADAVDQPARQWRKNRRPLPAVPVDWIDELTGISGPNEPFLDVRGPDADESDARYKVPDYDPDRGIPPNLPPPEQYRDRKLESGQTGVDLNRNFSTAAWGFDCAFAYKNYNPAAGTYFGNKAGGEVETANVQGLVESLNGFATTIDYHTYGQFILYPEEAVNSKMVSPDYTRMGETLNSLIKSQDGQGYTLGTGMALIQIEANGTTADYLAQRKQARAFTIELDPGYYTVNPDGAGFLLPETKVMALFETNIRGALAAIAGAPRKLDTVGVVWRKEVFSATAIQFLPWDVYGRGNRLPVNDLPA
jgi:hypothetical protein